MYRTIGRWITVASAAGLLWGCADNPTGQESGTFYGSDVPLGNGVARSYVVLDDGTPTELGFALSESALTNLPPAEPGNPHPSTMLDLPLPAEASGVPYQLLELDWNPIGHEPPGVYDVPHFDFHFYTIPAAQRNAIDPSDPEFQAKADRHPSPEFLPAGYFAIPGAVPHMGVHWADPAAPELNGQPFTRTFIYGTWDGNVIFQEPMITKAFLETKPNVSATLPLPQKYAATGEYPTAERIYWDAGAGEYRVALTGFVAR